MKSKFIKNLEWSILICCIILLLIGMVALYSATQDNGNSELKKQIVWATVSLPIIIIVMFIDYNKIAKISPILYMIFIIALIAVLFTEPINGAKSWFQINEWATIQPSEFAKIAFIIFLSYIIAKLQNGDKREINKFWKLLITILILAIPAVLIMLQPDYGTLMAFVIAYVFMMYAGGIDKRLIIFSMIIVMLAIPLAYFFVLPDHAKTRIDVFLNPDLDPRGSGYNVIQSKLAIGSGQLLGMGLLKGNQTQLGFLYLLPITGVPLPFVSYGGSSLVTNFICIGLLLGISGRRQKAIFMD